MGTIRWKWEKGDLLFCAMSVSGFAFFFLNQFTTHGERYISALTLDLIMKYSTESPAWIWMSQKQIKLNNLFSSNKVSLSRKIVLQIILVPVLISLHKTILVKV